MKAPARDKVTIKEQTATSHVSRASVCASPYSVRLTASVRHTHNVTDMAETTMRAVSVLKDSELL